MSSAIALVAMVVMGAIIAAQGWTTLIWFPLGLLYALFGMINMLLLPLMGLPMASRLKQSGMAKEGLHGAVLRATLVCLIIFALPVVVVFAVWPSLAMAAAHNTALLAGLVVGSVGVLATPLSGSQRKDFELDFFKRFMSHLRPVEELLPKNMMEKLQQTASDSGEPQ